MQRLPVLISLFILLFFISCAEIPKEIFDPNSPSQTSELPQPSEPPEDQEQSTDTSTTTTPPTQDQAEGDTQVKQYNIFYDEGDHLKELALPVSMVDMGISGVRLY